MRLAHAEVKKVMDKQFSAGSPLSSKQDARKCEVGELSIALGWSDHNVFEFRSILGKHIGGGRCCFQNVNIAIICGGCTRNICSTKNTKSTVLYSKHP